MRIAGLQKMTLLDYPGQVACTIFLQGCNFRCPFCHNRDLLPLDAQPQLTQEELLSFLQKRRGLLDGVCVTGGEPTLQKDLPEFLEAIKQMGFAVKLDTNGARPEMLKAVVETGCVDYVAMDIKNSPQAYPETAGIGTSLLSGIEESIRFLLSDAVDYEFRTTVVEEFHNVERIRDMGDWVQTLGGGKTPKRWYLQCYTDRDSVLLPGLHAPQVAQIQKYAEILVPFASLVSLRGVE